MSDTKALAPAPQASKLENSPAGAPPAFVPDPAQVAAALGLQEHLSVLSLDLEGQGVAHRADGKVVFIDGALPYEVVSARIHRSKGCGYHGRTI